MTAAVTAVNAEVIRTPAEIRRGRILGILYLVMAAFVYLVFTLGVESGSVATFGLSRPTDTVSVPDAMVGVRPLTTLIAVIFAFLGATQLRAGIR